MLVVFTEGYDKRRLWNTSIGDFNFNYINIFSKAITLFSKKITIPKLKKKYQLIKKHDIIILTSDATNILIMLYVFFVAKLLRKKIILWSSLRKEYFIFKPNDLPSRIIRYLFNIIEKRTNAFIVYGNRVKDYLIKNNINKKKIFQGTQCLLLTEKQINKKSSIIINNKNKLKRNKIFILTVSYLFRLKGIDDLIITFNKLKYNNIELRIVGSGPMEQELKKISSSNVNIKFLGNLDGKKKYEEYKNADLFVMPSYMDAWGLVVNEAMSFGLPVIVSSGACCSDELVHDNGFIFEPSDLDVLKKQLIKLIDNPQLRFQMGEKSLKIISRYTIDYATKAFSKAIDYAINK